MEKKTEKIIIDAKDKILGRVASEVAVLLMGKNKPDYAANKVANVKVEIMNASKIKIGVKKMAGKNYKRYSGYPGGLKEFDMNKLVADHGFSEVFRKAVRGMLPSNRLRSIIIKNLTVTE